MPTPATTTPGPYWPPGCAPADLAATHDGLLAGLLAEPWAADRRQVFSDWLQDHATPEWQGWGRRHLHGLVLRHPDAPAARLLWADWVRRGSGADAGSLLGRQAALVRDQAAWELLEKLGPDAGGFAAAHGLDTGGVQDRIVATLTDFDMLLNWLEPPPPGCRAAFVSDPGWRHSPVTPTTPGEQADSTYGVVGWQLPADGRAGVAAEFAAGYFRLGFPSRLVCRQVHSWLEYGHELVRRHPVCRVTVSDRDPLPAVLNVNNGTYGAGCWLWHATPGGPATAPTPAHLPRVLWDALPRDPLFAQVEADCRPERVRGYASRGDALDALAEAALAVARGRAGLHPERVRLLGCTP